MEMLTVLKAVSDGTRLKILTRLLQHHDCVRALAQHLSLTEATVSQHLKILREAGLLTGEKHGYFMHYDVERAALHRLAKEIGALAKMKRETCVQTDIERQTCAPETGGCHFDPGSGPGQCHAKGSCSEVTNEYCHGKKDGQTCHGNEG